MADAVPHAYAVEALFGIVGAVVAYPAVESTRIRPAEFVLALRVAIAVTGQALLIIFAPAAETTATIWPTLLAGTVWKADAQAVSASGTVPYAVAATSAAPVVATFLPVAIGQALAFPVDALTWPCALSAVASAAVGAAILQFARRRTGAKSIKAFILSVRADPA